MFRNSIALLGLLFALSSAEDYFYYGGVVINPTRSFDGPDSSKGEFFLAEGTYCAFVNGFAFGGWKIDKGFIKAGIFEDNDAGIMKYTYIPAEAVETHRLPCADRQYAITPGICGPVGGKGLFKQTWKTEFREAFKETFTRLDLTPAKKAVLKEEEYKKMVEAAQAHPARVKTEGEGDVTTNAMKTMAKNLADDGVKKATKMSVKKLDLSADQKAALTAGINKLAGVATSDSSAITADQVLEMLSQGMTKEMIVAKIAAAGKAEVAHLSEEELKKLEQDNPALLLLDSLTVKN